MNIINKKPQDDYKNVFYGVNVNDKQAVEAEYARLKKKHRRVTIFVMIVLAILAAIFFDFVRVNNFGGKPIVAIEKKVDNGTMFSGLGYKVLYCNDGGRYVGSVIYKTCDNLDMVSFSHVIYEKLIDYSVNNKTLNRDNLSEFNINSIEHDEYNDEGGSDYLLDVSYKCVDGSAKCFKTTKEYNDSFNIKIYVKVNKFNEIYEVIPFKSSGAYYDKLVEEYSEKVKNYLIENSLYSEDNVREYRFSIVGNNGKYKFRGITYADTYLVKIDYTCEDSEDTCVNAFDKKDYEGDYANLTFYASMFLNEEGEVVLVGPREYLDIE